MTHLEITAEDLGVHAKKGGGLLSVGDTKVVPKHTRQANTIKHAPADQ